MEKLSATEIDLIKRQSLEVIPEPTYPSSPASIALGLGATAMKFARIERVPRYDEKTRENDAEHSFMLALVATELASTLYPDQLNLGLVSHFCIVHDLIELKVGDVATFQISPEDLATKKQAEHAALEQLLNELPPLTAYLLYRYEQQEELEARFVRLIDKLLPVIVDILGEGKKVMAEDYGVTTQAQLVKAHKKLHERIANGFEEFPEIVEMHALLGELLALEYEPTIPKC